MNATIKVLVAAAALLACPNANAQHLWWNLEDQRDATCLYGTITVLATHPAIYYCGANWHPGEAAGGYCGIQHNAPQERRTIFSIWDTSTNLRPKITEADPYTQFGRFGGEGEGGHTHMVLPWKTGETFQYFDHPQCPHAQASGDCEWVQEHRVQGGPGRLQRESRRLETEKGGRFLPNHQYEQRLGS